MRAGNGALAVVPNPGAVLAHARARPLGAKANIRHFQDTYEQRKAQEWQACCNDFAALAEGATPAMQELLRVLYKLLSDEALQGGPFSLAAYSTVRQVLAEMRRTGYTDLPSLDRQLTYAARFDGNAQLAAIFTPLALQLQLMQLSRKHLEEVRKKKQEGAAGAAAQEGKWLALQQQVEAFLAGSLQDVLLQLRDYTVHVLGPHYQSEAVMVRNLREAAEMLAKLAASQEAASTKLQGLAESPHVQTIFVASACFFHDHTTSLSRLGRLLHAQLLDPMFVASCHELFAAFRWTSELAEDADVLKTLKDSIFGRLTGDSTPKKVIKQMLSLLGNAVAPLAAALGCTAMLVGAVVDEGVAQAAAAQQQDAIHLNMLEVMRLVREMVDRQQGGGQPAAAGAQQALPAPHGAHHG